MQVLVLGAGISGLTCARRLLQDGHSVRLWTRDDPLATTSSVAAAIWYPFEAGPPHAVRDWATRSLASFHDLARDPATGVSLRSCHDLDDRPRPLPDWAPSTPDLELRPRPGFPHSWSLTVPVIETPRYLPWLLGQIETLGGVIETRTVAALEEADAEVVVVCLGLGAREVVGDRELQAIRGQVVRATALPGLHCTLFERADGRFGYVIPRAEDTILGGTTDRGRESLEPDPDEVARIVERCTEVEPALAGVKVLDTRVGLRPGRRCVRLEAERRDGRLVVHDYGHGGCGFTLSHGCAEDVAKLVSEAG